MLTLNKLGLYALTVAKYTHYTMLVIIVMVIDKTTNNFIRSNTKIRISKV